MTELKEQVLEGRCNGIKDSDNVIVKHIYVYIDFLKNM